MAKGTSFADKSKKKKEKKRIFIKYVKSVPSDKVGYWRFNEQMIGLQDGENLDDAIRRLEDETQALDMNLPDLESAVKGQVAQTDETVSNDKVTKKANESPADKPQAQELTTENKVERGMTGEKIAVEKSDAGAREGAEEHTIAEKPETETENEPGKSVVEQSKLLK